MPSKYGGIPVEPGSKYGGLPVEDQAPLAQSEQGIADYARGIVNQAGQGLTLGFSDELAAASAAAIASLKDGVPFVDTYKDMVGPMRQDMDAFRGQNPKASLAANVGGGLATGVAGIARAGAALAPRGAGLGRSLLADAGVGAAEGGLAGAGFAAPGEAMRDAAIGATVGGVAGPVVGGVTRLFKNKSAVKQEAERLLSEGGSEAPTAKYILDGRGRLAKDPNAISAISSGFDEGVVAAVKGSSKTDRRKMLKMLNTLERGRADRRFSALNRPSDVVGDSVLARFKRVHKVNRAAAKKLDDVAAGLKGKRVDYSPAVDQFIDDLESMGVRFNQRDATVSFEGSDIEWAEGAEALISNLVKRGRSLNNPDGYNLHRLKRFIDEQVSYGKSASGLAGKAENVVKRFRHNLDGILDENFANYRMVNDAYSQTREVIDGLQDVAGQKMDLTGPNADKAIGTLSRRVLSKAQSRVNLVDALNDLEKVAVRYGGKYDDDLMTQLIFVDELDGLFGSAARTSFQGDIEKAVKATSRAGTREGFVDMIASGAQKAGTAIRGKSQEEIAIESMRRLLQQGL